ncbi:hypothetical protein E1B28_007369 [Marasmius oreades]|uniref:Uncharacterized protein n=1 Tax=Marasmius oreades TaxID=181124 RepID=A0A9P7S278_9AGAR|nr:uncharacterized protein E1B28_007369 [Marasmius oreades]KAG7093715.1 hypothetical protein E1B28_007369 [Marasmius oreades]
MPSTTLNWTATSPKSPRIAAERSLRQVLVLLLTWATTEAGILVWKSLKLNAHSVVEYLVAQNNRRELMFDLDRTYYSLWIKSPAFTRFAPGSRAFATFFAPQSHKPTSNELHHHN